MQAGCGEDGADGGESQPAPAGKGSALELTLDADGPGGEAPQTASIDCPGDRGCEHVDAISTADLAPVPPDVACTEIYGGPDTLTVTGTLKGEPAEAELTRENGCEISRFDAWVPLARELFEGYRPGASLAP